MGLIDSGSKSSRLLASRRYTHNTLTTAQESFTNVLDLRAEEIFTRAHLVPSSSLPFSGSSQLGLTHSAKGQPVVKYWFRQQLTKSNTNNEVWFFTNPTGSGDGIGAQLIDDNQQTNFVSPKYALSSLASATTEDSTPGYLAVLYKSTAVASSEETSSLGSGDIVSTNDYIFDYKTGVVQFLNSTKDPSDSEYVYMTAYQYVGDTLKSGIEIEGQVSASNLLVTDTLKAGTLISPEITLATASIAAITSSISRIDSEIDTNVANITLATASIAAITSSISRLDTESSLATASIAAITSSLSTISGTGELQGLGTTSSPLFNSVTASADVSASGNIYATGNLDIDGTSNFSSDVTIDSDLDVTGTITATEIHTTFISSSISVATGSNNFGDSNDDHHSFTGSLSVSSSLSVTGSVTVAGTLTADEIGAFTAGGAIDFGDQNMTNVDIDSGDITGVTFGTTTSTIISGSITAVSSSIATRFDSRETDMTLATASIAAITASISRIDSEIDTNSANMTLATASIAAITASISRIDSEIDTNSANMTLATASIAAITASVSRIDSEIDTNAANMTLATASIAAITASVAEMKEFTKATTISGSFTAVSSSIATRFDSREVDMTLATASIAAITASVSRIDSEIDTNAANITLATASIAAITASVAEMKEFTKASTISGSFTTLSGSVATRFDSREVDMTLATASIAAITASVAEMKGFTIASTISGSFTALSSSLASRLTAEEGEAEGSVVSSSAQIAVEISGSFTSLSGSVATRFDTNESNMTLATASIAAITASVAEMKEFTKASTISGSFTALSGSVATRFDSREVDMTLATASIAALTASISRLNDEISTDDTDMNLATASIAAITASISRLNSEIDEAGIFDSTGSFFRTHNDIQITGSLSVSGLITGSFSGLEVGQKYKHVQTTPSSTWTVSHGFDYQYVNIDVYNGSDELVIPASVVATDTNTITISFNTPLSGVAIVSTGGQAVDELGKNVIFEQPTVSTNWRVTHSIGEQYPAVTVYDDSDNVIIPERINAVDASHMDIIFTNAVSGNANISVGGGQLRNAITGSEQLSFDNFGDISGSISSTGSFGFLNVVGDGNIDGNLTLGGNITIGDADSDSITINADLTSNLIPNADSTFDLGSTSKFWRNAYIDSVTTTGNISGSVSSTGSFGNVNVSEMSIPSVSIMSSSVATRFDSREVDMTLATASIAAITSSVAEMKEFTNADTISGSFSSVSSSIASRLDSLSGDVIALSIALG